MIKLSSLQEKFKTLTCVRGDVLEITGLNQLKHASNTEATFLVDQRYRSLLKSCQAAVLITNIEEFPYAKEEFKGAIWSTPDPLSILGYLATFLEERRFGEDERWQEPGIHPTAIVEHGAQVHPRAGVGPYCIVRKGAVLEEGVSLMAYVYIGCHAKLAKGCTVGVGACVLAYTQVGSHTRIMPGAVIGSQGFGVLRNQRKQNSRIPQLGSTVIGSHARIGCNSTVDRATFGETKIGSRSFLDNLTQVGHNAQAGDDLILCSQSGMTGSSKVGNRVTLAAMSGLKDHITVGDDVTLGAFTAVVKDWDKPNTILKGYPAEPLQDYLRKVSLVRSLPKLFERIKDLEAEVAQLRQEVGGKRKKVTSEPEASGEAH